MLAKFVIGCGLSLEEASELFELHSSGLNAKTTRLDAVVVQVLFDIRNCCRKDSMSLTNYYSFTISLVSGWIFLFDTKTNSYFSPNSDDITKSIIPANISSDKLGDYISACNEDISVFVSKVTTSSSYSGIRIKTTSTGIDNIISIVLPVNPPYKDIIIRNGQFIVVPSSGDKLCVSSDGSAWDIASSTRYCALQWLSAKANSRLK